MVHRKATEGEVADSFKRKPNEQKFIDVKKAQERFNRRLQKRRQRLEMKRKAPHGFVLLLPLEILRIIVDLVGEGMTLLDLASTSRNMREVFLPLVMDKVTISCGPQPLALEASELFIENLVHLHLLRPLLLLYKEEPWPGEAPALPIPFLPHLRTLELKAPEPLDTGEEAVVTLPALNVIGPKIAARAPLLQHISAEVDLSNTYSNLARKILRKAWEIPGRHKRSPKPLHDRLSSITLVTALNPAFLSEGYLSYFFQSLSILPQLHRVELKSNDDTNEGSEDFDRCCFAGPFSSSSPCAARCLVTALEPLSHLEHLTLDFHPILFTDVDLLSCLLAHISRSSLWQRLKHLRIPMHLCEPSSVPEDVIAAPQSLLRCLELRCPCPSDDVLSWDFNCAAVDHDDSWTRPLFDRIPSLDTIKCITGGGIGIDYGEFSCIIARSGEISFFDPDRTASLEEFRSERGTKEEQGVDDGMAVDR